MKFKGREDIVKAIQKSLKITADGVDGKITWTEIIKGILKKKDREELIQCVQRILKVDDDGIDGPVTWKTIKGLLVEDEEPIIEDTPLPSKSDDGTEIPLAKKLVELAKREIGVEEVNGTNCGPRVNEYKSATLLNPKQGWPWCAAFICWLMREAMKDGSYTFKRPTTASAWGFEDWASKQNSKVQLKKPHKDDIKPGDIVMFTFSHIGLAISSPRNGYIDTIEGNTDGQGSREGGAVLQKKRKLSQIRSRIRILS